jgi:hypothetical protein
MVTELEKVTLEAYGILGIEPPANVLAGPEGMMRILMREIRSLRGLTDAQARHAADLLAPDKDGMCKACGRW